MWCDDDDYDNDDPDSEELRRGREEAVRRIEGYHRHIDNCTAEMSEFLASQDAQEVMLVTDLLTDWWLSDFTEVTLVSENAFQRLDWCDSGESRCLLETWLMLFWWLRIPKEDLTDVTLVSED